VLGKINKARGEIHSFDLDVIYFQDLLSHTPVERERADNVRTNFNLIAMTRLIGMGCALLQWALLYLICSCGIYSNEHAECDFGMEKLADQGKIAFLHSTYMQKVQSAHSFRNEKVVSLA